MLQTPLRFPMKRLAIYFSLALVLITSLALSTTPALAQNATEKKIKEDIQKQLGSRAKVDAVRATPLSGVYEISIGNDVVYTDTNARYLIQGEIVDLKTGINLTEQRSNDLNRIRWADLPLNDAVKVVKGKGTRQLAVFVDPNCGFCKKLEKSFQQMDDVTIYNFLIPILSPDSLTKSQQIWCSSDKAAAWTNWMINAQAPTGKTDCSTPLERNMALAKKWGVNGTPAIFFTDGSRIAGAVPLAQIEKKLK